MINPRTRETVKTLYKEVEEAENEPYKFVHAYLIENIYKQEEKEVNDKINNFLKGSTQKNILYLVID